MAKTKALVFEARKNAMPTLLYAGNAIEQVDIFKYLGVQMHGTKGLTPAMENLRKAAKRAMFGLQRRCQQLRIHDPTLKCKLFDTVVKPILCYGGDIWSVLGCKSAIADLERVQIGFLGVQIHTSTLHVLAEFGRYPLKIAWQAQAAKYLSRLESMDDTRTLKQAFVADRRLPKQKSWSFQLEAQLRDVSVNVPTTDGHSHRCFSIQSAQSAHIAQLSRSTSSRAATCRDVKVGYGCEPHIQQSNNRHLRRIVAQVRTGFHWLNVETGRHKKVDRSGRICPMCVGKITNPDVLADCFDAFDSDEDAPDPIEDEHHAIFECSAYATTRQMFSDLFPSHVFTVSQFLNQPDCNRLAKFLTLIRMLHLNTASSDGSARPRTCVRPARLAFVHGSPQSTNCTPCAISLTGPNLRSNPCLQLL